MQPLKLKSLKTSLNKDFFEGCKGYILCLGMLAVHWRVFCFRGRKSAPVKTEVKDKIAKNLLSQYVLGFCMP